MGPDEVPRLSFGFAARNALGVAVPLVAGVLADDVPAGAVAGGGALITGFADVGDTRRHRAVAMLITALAGSVSTLAGVIVADLEIAALLAAFLWGVAAGLLVAAGPIAGTVGLSATVALLVFAGETTGPHHPLELAGFTLAGGVFQAVLAAAIPTAPGIRSTRSASGACFRPSGARSRQPTLSGATPPGWGSHSAPATAAYRLLPVDRGYWIPLTVLFVMRPEAGRTRTRILQRFAGTVLGLLAITLVVAILEPGDLALALICAACMLPAYAYLWIDYARFSAGIAGAAVALAAMLGLPEPIAALNRLLDTVVGLAIIAFFLALLPETPRGRREPAPAEG